MKQKILFSGLEFADLDQTAWMKFQPLECAELGKQILDLIDRQWDQVVLATEVMTFWPKGVPILLDQIDLETRTLGLVVPLMTERTADEVRKLKLGDLFHGTGFGVVSLVDWLTTMEYQQISCKTRSAKGLDVGSESEGLGIHAAVIDALKMGINSYKCFQQIRLPKPPPGYSLKDLGLENRTFRCLEEAGYGRNISRLGSITLADAFELPSFGRKCAIDLFSAIERAKAKKVDPAWSRLCDPYDIVLEQLALPGESIPDWIRSLRLPKLPPSVGFEDLQISKTLALSFQKLCKHKGLERISEISFGDILKQPRMGKFSVRKLLKQFLHLRKVQSFVDVESVSQAEQCKSIINRIVSTEGVDNVDISDPRLGIALSNVFPSLKRLTDLGSFQHHPLLFARRESLEYLEHLLDSFKQKPVESEFLEIFSKGRGSKRLVQILSERYGLLGNASKSLKQIAEEQGVRPQRIQQICQISTKSISELHVRPYAPSIDRAIGLIEEALPMRRSKIEKLLKDSKLIHRNGNFASIKSIAALLGRSLNAEPLDESEDSYVLSASQQNFVELAKKHAISAAAKQSPISVLSLASKFKSEFGKPVHSDLLEEALRSIKSHRWFKDKSGWYGLPRSQLQLLEIRIRETLENCQKISITQLRESLLHASENRQQIPKIELLTLVCQMIPTVRIKNGVLSVSIKDDV